jgi:hypothetical protein
MASPAVAAPQAASAAPARRAFQASRLLLLISLSSSWLTLCCRNQGNEKPMEVRLSNMTAAKGDPSSLSLHPHPSSLTPCLRRAAVADAVRTSLGPRGMDKMIQTAQGEVVITNDGATILKHMSVMHPAARMVSSQPLPASLHSCSH